MSLVYHRNDRKQGRRWPWDQCCTSGDNEGFYWETKPEPDKEIAACGIFLVLLALSILAAGLGFCCCEFFRFLPWLPQALAAACGLSQWCPVGQGLNTGPLLWEQSLSFWTTWEVPVFVNFCGFHFVILNLWSYCEGYCSWLCVSYQISPYIWDCVVSHDVRTEWDLECLSTKRWAYDWPNITDWGVAAGPALLSPELSSCLIWLSHICSTTDQASWCHRLLFVSDTYINVMAIAMIWLIHMGVYCMLSHELRALDIWYFKSSQHCKTSVIIIFNLHIRKQMREAKLMVPLTAFRRKIILGCPCWSSG